MFSPEKRRALLFGVTFYTHAKEFSVSRSQGSWAGLFEAGAAPAYDFHRWQRKGNLPVPGRMSRPVEIYQIKVTLRESLPAIWRRVQVRSDITLAKLHRILQRVMGWEDTHLHQFVIQDERYGAPHKNDEGPRKMRDERKHKLGDMVPAEGSEFRYEYDFGDDWQHVLLIEKILSPQENVRYPLCLAGARACPPEDVGGISGYENFLQAIRDSKQPEHDELLAWVGGAFDPEEFDVDQINQKLRSIR